MTTLQDLIKSKRNEMKLSLRDASKFIGISHSYLSTLEKGIDPRSGIPIKPTPEILKLISKTYDISYIKLMKLSGYIEDEKNKSTKSKPIDIAIELDKLIELLKEDDDLLFDGNPMYPESIEFLIDSIK